MKIYKSPLGYTVRANGFTMYADEKTVYNADSYMGRIDGEEVNIDTLPKELAAEMLKGAYWRPPLGYSER